MILLVLLAQPSAPEDAKVDLDSDRLQEDIPKGLQKVELDLDDALFLEFEDKEEPAAQSTPAPQAEEQALPAPPLPLWKNRKLLIAAGVFALAGVAGAAFFLRVPAEPVIQTDQPAPAKTTAPKQDLSLPFPPQSTAPSPPPYTFDSFQVEYAQDGQIRLLTCRFDVLDANQTLALEMRAKNIVLRDGVYRYLKNTPLSFLDDPKNSEKLKTDIVAVLNQSLKSGQVSSILIEEYVVQ